MSKKVSPGVTRQPTSSVSPPPLPPVRKIGTYDSPRNRRTVVDEYDAGPPEKVAGSYIGVLRRSGKRDFSPYLKGSG